MKRQVPLFRVQASPGADYTTLIEMPEIRKVVLSEAVSAIAEGIEKKKAAVSLFEVAQTDYYIDIDNTKYKEVLENIMNHYIKIEDYDMCIKIRDLIEKL